MFFFKFLHVYCLLHLSIFSLPVVCLTTLYQLKYQITFTFHEIIRKINRKWTNYLYLLSLLRPNCIHDVKLYFSVAICSTTTGPINLTTNRTSSGEMKTLSDCDVCVV